MVIKHISIYLLAVVFLFYKMPIRVVCSFFNHFLLIYRTFLVYLILSVSVYLCIYLPKTILSSLTSFNKNNDLQCVRPYGFIN